MSAGSKGTPRQKRIEETAHSVVILLDNWLRCLPAKYVGKPLTQADVTVVADAANRLRTVLRDRRRRDD